MRWDSLRWIFKKKPYFSGKNGWHRRGEVCKNTASFIRFRVALQKDGSWKISIDKLNHPDGTSEQPKDNINDWVESVLNNSVIDGIDGCLPEDLPEDCIEGDGDP